MGGRGGTSGLSSNLGPVARKSNEIRADILQKAMNSKFKGVARDARNGTGAYSFKDATPVSASDAKKMMAMTFVERGENTLVHGVIGNKSVFIADKSDSSIIEELKRIYKERKNQRDKESAPRRPEVKTTTTYDRWLKKNKRKMDDWFGRR